MGLNVCLHLACKVFRCANTVSYGKELEIIRTEIDDEVELNPFLPAALLF